MKIAIVTGQFNPEISARLLEGAQSVLLGAGLKHEDIRRVSVPGTYEIPLMVQTLAKKKKWDAIIALGCVIRGNTVHFDVICQSVAQALQQLSLQFGLPMTSGILMVENRQQAMERSGEKVHRGEEAARAALEMVRSLNDLS